MLRKVLRRMRNAGIAITAAVAVMAGTAGTASATALNPRSWVENPEICRWSSCYNDPDLIRFWQSILWADNLGGGITAATVDGQFGSNTETRTKRWQSDSRHLDYNGNRLTADGEVGPRTWYAAQYVETGDGIKQAWCVYDTAALVDRCTYSGRGTGREFTWRVYADGTWFFTAPTGYTYQLV